MTSLVAHEGTRKLLAGWMEDLAQVIESMTDRRPAVQWRAATGTADSLGVGNVAETAFSFFRIHCPQAAGMWIATQA